MVDKIESFCGGKGGNQACSAARLGGDVTMLGCVGDDEDGKALISSLRKDGADVSHIRFSKTSSTGKAYITVSQNGENTICVYPGANSEISIAYVESVRNIIEEAAVLLLQLEIPYESVRKAAQIAHEAGCKVILDPSPLPASLPEDFFKDVDITKPNEIEAGKLLNGEPMESGYKTFLKKSLSLVINTLGGEGCALYDKDGKHTLEAVPVKAIDTTAAGDTFLGAFAICLARGDDYLSAAEFANKASAIAVSRPGAQESIPYKEELMEGLILSS